MSQPTPFTDMIAAMLKDCMPYETIIVAVRSYELSVSTRHQVDETAEKRRAWDREYRKRIRKGRVERPPDPPDIHPTSTRVHPTNSLSLRVEDSFALKEVRKKEARARGTKLPPDWVPSQRFYDRMLSENRASAPVVDRALKKMRTWAEANSNRQVTTKANWERALESWIEREINANGFDGNRADTAAGRATAREAHGVATMVGSAMQYFKQGADAGRGREASDGSDPADWADAQYRRTGVG